MINLEPLLKYFSDDDILDLYIDIGNYFNLPNKLRRYKSRDLDHIQKIIEDIMHVSISEHNRKQDTVVGRQIFFYIIYKSGRYNNISEIGERFGIKTHTTIIHGVNAIENYIDTRDKIYYDKIIMILTLLKKFI